MDLIRTSVASGGKYSPASRLCQYRVLSPVFSAMRSCVITTPTRIAATFFPKRARMAQGEGFFDGMPGIVAKMKSSQHEALPRAAFRCRWTQETDFLSGDILNETKHDTPLSMPLPITSLSLLSRLRDEGDDAGWQVSWKRFLELYHSPLMAMATGIYRYQTGNAEPPEEAIEDVVASVVVDFFKRDRFDPERGRLRTYLRVLTNARIVDMLRKEKPLDHESITAGRDALTDTLPAESPEEERSFQQALLATLIEDLREHIPLRQFEIFEMVKLVGMSPDLVATELGVQRGVIDNTIYKVMTRLREIAASPEYQEEYYS